MLAKKFRIQSNRIFKQIYKIGKKIHVDLLVVRFISNKFGHPRFGIVISKKVSSKAVKRNKLKRQITDILRQHLANFDKSYDIILIAKKNIVDVTYQEISKDINQILTKLK